MLKNKFRVWCKNNNQWEEDFCAIDQDGQLYQVVNAINYSPKMIRISEENHIVEMYTGLNDSTRSEEFPDGRPIFEGDIVEICNGKINVVVFEGGGFGYISKSLKRLINFGTHGIQLSILENIKVIGNIHENKELLDVV